MGSVTFYIVHPRIRKRHRQSEKYAAPLQLQGLEKRFIPSAVWDTPSLPQNGVVFRWIFLIFFSPSIIILLILEKYQAHGYSSNLSSTFNCVETKGTCFLFTNEYLSGGTFTRVGIILAIFPPDCNTSGRLERCFRRFERGSRISKFWSNGSQIRGLFAFERVYWKNIFFF